MISPVPILMYHSVGTTSSDAYKRWTVSEACFARHMDFLADRNYRPISISTLASLIGSGSPVPPNSVAITFDDGLRDFLTGALPVLRRHDFAATLFVVTGYVGQTSQWLQPLGEGMRPMLNWVDLREIAASGIECGAHTVSHPQLDIVPPERAFEEIRKSKLALEDQLDRPITAFAYPHGYASRQTRRLVREAGFASACRVRHALSATSEDLFSLSRIIVTEGVDENELGRLLVGSGLPVAPPRDYPAAVGWRLVRRLRSWGQRIAEPVHHVRRESAYGPGE